MDKKASKNLIDKLKLVNRLIKNPLTLKKEVEYSVVMHKSSISKNIEKGTKYWKTGDLYYFGLYIGKASDLILFGAED